MHMVSCVLFCFLCIYHESLVNQWHIFSIFIRAPLKLSSVKLIDITNHIKIPQCRNNEDISWYVLHFPGRIYSCFAGFCYGQLSTILLLSFRIIGTLKLVATLNVWIIKSHESTMYEHNQSKINPNETKSTIHRRYCTFNNSATNVVHHATRNWDKQLKSKINNLNYTKIITYP